jgi:hypothetical protein
LIGGFGQVLFVSLGSFLGSFRKAGHRIAMSLVLFLDFVHLDKHKQNPGSTEGEERWE